MTTSAVPPEGKGEPTSMGTDRLDRSKVYGVLSIAVALAVGVIALWVFGHNSMTGGETHGRDLLNNLLCLSPLAVGLLAAGGATLAILSVAAGRKAKSRSGRLLAGIGLGLIVITCLMYGCSWSIWLMEAWI